MKIILTILGLIPFVTLSYINIVAMHVGVDSYSLLLAYSCVIIAFLAGSQWGFALSHNLSNYWLIHSNVLALLVCAAWYVNSVESWLLLLCCLWYCYVLDVVLYRRNLLDMTYLTTRFCVSIVVSCVFIAEVLLLTYGSV